MTALVLVIALFGQEEMLEAPPAPPTHDHTEQAWRGMYTANVHVRYHSAKAEDWMYYDIIATPIIMLLCSNLLFCFLALNLSMGHTKAWICSMTAGTILFLSLNFHPLHGRRMEHLQCRTRWEVLGLKYEWMWDDIELYPDPQRRLDELLSERTAIEKDEPPGPDIAFLGECQEAENRSWGLSEEKITD